MRLHLDQLTKKQQLKIPTIQPIIQPKTKNPANNKEDSQERLHPFQILSSDLSRFHLAPSPIMTTHKISQSLYFREKEWLSFFVERPLCISTANFKEPHSNLTFAWHCLDEEVKKHL